MIRFQGTTLPDPYHQASVENSRGGEQDQAGDGCGNNAKGESKNMTEQQSDQRPKSVRPGNVRWQTDFGSAHQEPSGNHDKQVTSDHNGRKPDRQIAIDDSHDSQASDKNLVGNRIESDSHPAHLIKTPRQVTIQSIGQPGYHHNGQTPDRPLGIILGYEVGGGPQEQYPRKANKIRNLENLFHEGIRPDRFADTENGIESGSARVFSFGLSPVHS